MKIGIISSGVVAQTLGSKLVALGHDLVLGTRDPDKLDDKKMFGATLREWKSQTDGRAAADKVGAKVLIDVANEPPPGHWQAGNCLPVSEFCPALVVDSWMVSVRFAASVSWIDWPEERLLPKCQAP